MSHERLSHGVRIHNRKEKAAARAEGRRPNLIRPTIHVESYQPRLKSEISQTIISEPKHAKRVTVARRSQPTIDEIMTAGSRLSGICRGYNFDNEEKEYINDRSAVNILEELAEEIHTGKVLRREEIARQVYRLGFKIGPMGSVSTEIDIAALSVINSIKANKDRLT